MDNLNMLSVKKVKLHGMTSTRWTVRDKITQYKGLINLYKRDRKIIDVDRAVGRKKQARNLKQLQKDIEANRGKLDNAIKGNKQQLRNILQDHRELQLAYQDSPSKKVVECIHQNNFNKRKELDKLEYQMNIRSQKLINIKLLHATLEDRLNYEGPGQIPIEKTAQIITGKVQDATLKKEAAIAIRHSYIQMINIMKRDALYFDAILATIRNDGINQGRCMINATKLGQLAMEYLDDRRQEYKELEEAVKKDLLVRRQDLINVREQVQKASLNIKNLLRRDSDINLGTIELEETKSETELYSGLSKVKATLREIRQITHVAYFSDISPCLLEQMNQRERLIEFVNKNEENRDILLNKRNHAELMKNVMENKMVETTFEYKKTKEDLTKNISDEIERKKHLEAILKNRFDLIAKVRISLRQLQQICHMMDPHEHNREHPEQGSDEDIAIEPTKDEIDGCKMIPELLRKFTKLVSRITDKPVVDEAYKFFENMVSYKARVIQVEKSVSDESLTEGLVAEISNVLTRDDIKKQSAEIVAMNSKNEDLVPVFGADKKKKRKFKF